MSAANKSAAPSGKPGSFELKSAQLSLVSLLLKSTDMAVLQQEWQAQYGDDPEFFDQDPLVIDLSPLAHEPAALPPFAELLTLLRRSRLCPMAVRGGSPAQTEAAVRAGLVVAQDVVLAKAATQPVVPEPAAPAPVQAPAPEPTPEPVPVAPAPLGALVVDKPLRSGQQVYARGRDLVVLAMVNPGAEVIADGNIHVYAPLRGKAIAGARGDASARIFTLALEAELVSIAGVYRTSEVPLPANVAGQAAVIRLHSGPDGDKLVMDPLKA
ncbi:septum site-determining protein MinC [Hydrogenophaga soli]